MMDLTTLEGKDTPGKIRALCAKAIHPKPGDPTIPSVAAICVYPALVAEAKDALAGSTRQGRERRDGLPVRPDVPRHQGRRGARGGRGGRGRDRHGHRPRARSCRATTRRSSTRSSRSGRRDGDAHLKVILETGELETFDNVRRAIDPRDGRGRRLHQDLDRQGPARGDAAGDARDARGDPRLREGDRPRRSG